ncbi:MAG: hypothetical protein GX147_05505 [Deltaproteobacteria bacterium]|jgi:murein lipoprotein|nr:hypothetical protein [Deltaproteobacteria bacterium]
MKKRFLMISLMVVFALALGGCATTGDLERVQAQERETSAKADQALQAAEDANTNALKAAEAAARAEEALKAAETRAAEAEAKAAAAEERATKAEGAFEKSMRK